MDDQGKCQESPKQCTCHPDDNPPVPCPRKHALHECIAAADPSNWRPGIMERNAGFLKWYAPKPPQFDAEAVRRDIAVLADKLDALTATVGQILQIAGDKDACDRYRTELANAVTRIESSLECVLCELRQKANYPSPEQQAAAHKLYLHDEARAAMRAVDKVRR